MRRFSLALGLLLALTLPCVAAPDTTETRLALVIGEANYKIAPLATPANDAGLVAETLKEAGFTVTGGADLNGADLRKALQDFITEAQQAGPNAILFVYLAGRGMQFAGQNYFIPVDAFVQREADVPVVAVRLADYFDRLIAAPARARIFVLDAARVLHFATEGAPYASGFGIENAPANTIYAFNEAPGAVSPDEPGPYGIYAQSLVEMLRQGYALPAAFTAARLRADALSDGIIVPWDASQIEVPFALFGRNETAGSLPGWQTTMPLAALPAAQAYWLAVERDTLDDYADFCAAFPIDPLTLRVGALLATRREALTWQAATAAGTPQAIWTYMRRYPRGPHFPDARRRLVGLAAPLDPPPRFDPYDFAGLAAPSEGELETLDRPVMTFDDPAFPPPPPINDLLPERPVAFEHLLPPVAGAPGRLPTPAPLVLPFSKPVVVVISATPPQPTGAPALPTPAAKIIGVPPMPSPVVMPSAAPSAPAAAPLPPRRPSEAASTSKPARHKGKSSRIKRAPTKSPRHEHGAHRSPHAKKKHRRS
jgi:uncharacterized caspase-like protein